MSDLPFPESFGKPCRQKELTQEEMDAMEAAFESAGYSAWKREGGYK